MNTHTDTTHSMHDESASLAKRLGIHGILTHIDNSNASSTWVLVQAHVYSGRAGWWMAEEQPNMCESLCHHHIFLCRQSVFFSSRESFAKIKKRRTQNSPWNESRCQRKHATSRGGRGWPGHHQPWVVGCQCKVAAPSQLKWWRSTLEITLPNSQTMGVRLVCVLESFVCMVAGLPNHLLSRIALSMLVLVLLLLMLLARVCSCSQRLRRQTWWRHWGQRYHRAYWPKRGLLPSVRWSPCWLGTDFFLTTHAFKTL